MLVAGGGVGALEAVLALDALAPHIETTVLTRATEYVAWPTSVDRPSVDGPVRRFALDDVLPASARVVTENLAGVSASTGTATTDAGTLVDYDALIVAGGARPVVRYPYAITVDDRKVDALMDRTLCDIEARDIRSVAFVASDRTGWSLPLYTLALFIRDRAWAVGADVATVIVTPEDRPLEAFGATVSRKASDLLHDAGIEVHTSVSADVPRRREVVCNPGRRRIRVDRVIALPELFGPAVSGLPANESGFLPVDARGRVQGMEAVFAVGETTDLPSKHHGIAAQMAVTAARQIAADAGLDLEASPATLGGTYLESRLREIDERRPTAVDAAA